MTRRALPLSCLLILAGCTGTDAIPDAGTTTKGGARILSFRTSQTAIEYGQSIRLAWETSGASGVNIEPRIGLQPPNGQADDKPNATTTYTLAIPGGPSELTSQVTVTVMGGPPLVKSFVATPRTIPQGGSAHLEWTALNADGVTIEPGLGAQAAMGGIDVTPSVTTTYRLTARNGTRTSQLSEVTVVVASGNQPVVLNFTATPRTVPAGEEVTLEWETTNANTLTIDNGVGQQAPNGSVVVRPLQTTTYTLSAVGPGGTTNASVNISVTPVGNPTVERFNATPATIAPGGTATLDWDTDNATDVAIDQGIGPKPAKGNVQVAPTQTTTYKLTAFGNSTQATQQVTVTVAGPNQPVILTFTAQPAAVLEGGTTTLAWTTQNATSVDIDNGVGTALPSNSSVQIAPTQSTTYTLTARNGTERITGQLTVELTTGVPTITSFRAQPASVNPGQSATLTWQTRNATGVSIDNGVGARAPNATAQVTPTQTTLYTLTASGPGGQSTAIATVTVAPPGAPTIASFTGTPQQVGQGGQATLSWQVTGATSVTIDNGVGARPASGSAQVTPANTTTYTLTAVVTGGQTNGQVTINVASSHGDRCSDAFLLSQSGTFTGNTQTAADDYSASASCTGYSSTGPDVVYRVSLQGGDRFKATVTPQTPSWDASIYLVTSCSAISSSCVAGQDNGNPEQIEITSATSGDYFLIVDGYGGAGGNYSLSIELTAAPVANDLCGGAINATQGGAYTGNTRNASPDYSPGAGGCTGYSETSNDVAYRVSLAQGDRLQATLSASWDSALYVVTNCSSIASTCVAGQDSGNPEQIDFTASNAGTYYIIVDGWGAASGTFTLNVTVSPPVLGGETCQDPVMVPAAGGSFVSTTAGLSDNYNPPLTCTGFAAPGADRVYSIGLSAGDIVEALAEFASSLDGSLYAVTNCSSLSSCVAGADTGVSGEPEELRFVARTSGPYFLIVDAFQSASQGTHDLTLLRYSGDRCEDAAPLDRTNRPEYFTTIGKTNDYSPNSGGCTVFTASGGDRAYSVAIQAGDQLQVTVDPEGYDASLYLVSNCADITGSCVAGSDGNGPVTERLSPVLQQSGTYYLIVDGFGAEQGAGTITATIARGDACGDAYLVPAAGGTFQGTTSGYDANHGTATETGSCTGYSQTGRDAVYEVSIPNGQTLQASVSSTWDSALYLVTSCPASATTCVAGQDNGNPEVVTYTNNSGAARSYYLVVDSWLLSTETTAREGNYTLTISIQ